MIAGIALIFIVTTLVTAWWPFIAYDTQWVYGYNARIFLLEERIPDDMGYYPQLIPLSYTYMQQAWNTLYDPGDGSLHQEYNFTLLKYAGSGRFSYEEDIYNPAHFASMLEGWQKRRDELATRERSA